MPRGAKLTLSSIFQFSNLVMKNFDEQMILNSVLVKKLKFIRSKKISSNQWMSKNLIIWDNFILGLKRSVPKYTNLCKYV